MHVRVLHLRPHLTSRPHVCGCYAGLTDVVTMLSEVLGEDYRSKAAGRHLERTLCKLDLAGDPVSADVSLFAFTQVISHARVLLGPAFDLQHAFQHTFIGEAFWTRQT